MGLEARLWFFWVAVLVLDRTEHVLEVAREALLYDRIFEDRGVQARSSAEGPLSC